ncbi:hypothetical protein BO83DRAFT_384456 [Aspergillus eucalypticola CBS 122712]|uniref:Uncharacterized protein n=1 Tax=Aspergillus eucalypticola (strain CBS 122712 / IBT 29274) TaxID=1448314 RepID=A0A317WCQ4_ASPEC|nr:uncharacterized protein BO83DRAFT_384456 [Aspergillus eucalypticola CBS 122712]PWY84019.1 hypothetical protein BO83DRAFT_384456 [Aspergillus eucalypticola CBS 122712]
MEHELLLGVLNVVIDAWEMKFHLLEVQGSEEEGIWYYRQNPESDVTKRHPEMPCFWTNEGRREYTQWESHNRVLFDDVDRICRLLKASKSAPSPTRTMGSKAW